MILDPVPNESPDPDCFYCDGEGVPQSIQHRFLADDFSNKACPKCWSEGEAEETKE